MHNNPIIVQKYGGACLETPARIRAVASSLADSHSRGYRVVAIVSAMGKTTDELVKMAYQVSPHPNRRELDMLLTTGERISMSLMSMALSDLGVPAISFTGSQAGVMKEVLGMESGKVLAVNSMARIEHVEIDSADLNQGFEKFAQHLKQNGLPWPQLLASAFAAGKTRIMMTCDSESLDTLLRTLERSKDLRKQRETLSSVSLTCFGGVSSDLPFKAIQILQHHGIIADKYILSPHSVNLFVPVES